MRCHRDRELEMVGPSLSSNSESCWNDKCVSWEQVSRTGARNHSKFWNIVTTDRKVWFNLPQSSRRARFILISRSDLQRNFWTENIWLQIFKYVVTKVIINYWQFLVSVFRLTKQLNQLHNVRWCQNNTTYLKRNQFYTK